MSIINQVKINTKIINITHLSHDITELCIGFQDDSNLTSSSCSTF